jgi:hypothetical protein
VWPDDRGEDAGIRAEDDASFREVSDTLESDTKQCKLSESMEETNNTYLVPSSNQGWMTHPVDIPYASCFVCICGYFKDII